MLLMGLLAFLLTFGCLELIVISGHISPLWFSTALMTVAVFRAPSRHVPLLLLGCVIGTALANAIIIGPALANLKLVLLNLIQAVAGGIALRILLNRRAPLNSLLDWARFVISVGIVTPMLGGLLAMWMLDAAGRAALPFYYTWVISEIIGMLALGPVLLLVPLPLKFSAIRAKRAFETLLILLITCCASFLTLRFMPWPFTFIVVILSCCAVHLPKLDAFLLFLLNACFISLLLGLGLVRIDARQITDDQVASWLPFLLVLIPSHLMALVMDAFRRERKHISESETRFRHAMEYSAIGMALVTPEGIWQQVNNSLCLTFGYPKEELMKMTFQQITYPDDLQDNLQQLERLKTGEIDSCDMEKRYYRKDGEIVWARLTVSLVRDHQRQPLYFIAQIIDISELKKIELVNHRLMERITLANEAGGVGVWEWNLLSGEMVWDKRMYALFGVSPHETPSYDLWLHLIHPSERESTALIIQRAIERRSAFQMEFRLVLPDGQRAIRTQANRILNRQGRLERMLGICQDITALRDLNDALFQEKERMAITLDAIGEAVISTDSAMCVTFMNPVAEKLSGWKQQQAAGKPLSELLHITHGLDGARVENLLRYSLPEGKIDLDDDLVLHAAEGQKVGIHFSITPLRTLTGEEPGAVMVIQDVSESRKVIKDLSYNALHDVLTRLPNRASFELRLKRLLSDAIEYQQYHVLTFIDLDRFKSVNDTAGHAAGDALLGEIAEVMQRHLRATDFLARLGGDEFALLLPECQIAQAGEVVQRIVQAVHEYRFAWRGAIFQIGASAGLTQISCANALSAEVMSQADVACYNAKKAGRGQLARYAAEEHDETLNSLPHQPLATYSHLR